MLVGQLVSQQRATGQTSLYHSQQSGLVQQMQAIATHNTYNLLKDINAPTLIITGDSDVAIPPANSDVQSRKISGLKPEIIKEAGHGFPCSHTNKTAELLINSWQEV